jgi:hypothetical protein
MSKERKKRVVVFNSVNYPDAVQIVEDLAQKEDRSLGQSAAMLVREANHIRVHGCTCGKQYQKPAV